MIIRHTRVYSIFHTEYKMISPEVKYIVHKIIWKIKEMEG